MARGRSRKVKRDEPLPPVENMGRPTFHTFLSLPNTNVARGIIVPQTVIDYYNLPPLHYMYATEPSAALFFTTPDNAIKFTDARRHLPPGTQTGVRLADALTQDAAALEFDAARDGPTMAGFSDTQLEFAIKVSGLHVRRYMERITLFVVVDISGRAVAIQSCTRLKSARAGAPHALPTKSR